MLRTGDTPAFSRPARKTGVDDFKEYLTKRYTEHGLSAERLLGEIRAQGFAGSIYMVRRFIKRLRPLRAAASTATLRFETAPGEQAQCDWAYCGRHPDRAGRVVSVYAFVLVLSFSRAMFVKFTSHHGFAIKTCRVRRPRTKGKVERMVDYVKDNFLLGRAFADMDDLNSQSLAWLDNTAHVRVHATTGHRPVDLLQTEKAHLTSMESIRPYAFIERYPRKVAKESMVSFQSSRYSVPPVYVGREVTVELSGDHGAVLIRSGDAIVAEHKPAQRKGESVTQKEHLDELWKLAAQRTPTPLPSWQLTFDHAVAIMPLDRYQALVDLPAILDPTTAVSGTTEVAP
jgi:transposase